VLPFTTLVLRAVPRCGARIGRRIDVPVIVDGASSMGGPWPHATRTRKEVAVALVHVTVTPGAGGGWLRQGRRGLSDEGGEERRSV